MKEELRKLLNKIIIKVIELEIETDLIYPYLELLQYLGQDEVDLIKNESTTTKKLLVKFFQIPNFFIRTELLTPYFRKRLNY